MLKKPVVVLKKENYVFIFLHVSKEYNKCAIFEVKKILRILFWTFKICPKSKSASTFHEQNVSTFFLVPFFQFKYIYSAFFYVQ